MHRKCLSAHFAVTKRRLSLLIISSVWIAGLFFGLLFAMQSAAASREAVFLTAAREAPSLLRLCAVHLIPLFATAVCAAFCLNFITLLIVFSKALLYGYCLCGITLTFASAGWLIRLLFLFSNSISVVLLLWFSIRNTAAKRASLKIDLLFSLIIIFIICCIDFYTVSPYLMMLLNT